MSIGLFIKFWQLLFYFFFCLYLGGGFGMLRLLRSFGIWLGKSSSICVESRTNALVNKFIFPGLHCCNFCQLMRIFLIYTSLLNQIWYTYYGNEKKIIFFFLKKKRSQGLVGFFLKKKKACGYKNLLEKNNKKILF